MKVRLLLVLIVTAACLAWVVSRIDLRSAMQAAAGFSWGILLPVEALYLGAHALRALRFGALLGRPVPFRSLFSIVSIGFLAIHVVPLRMGEFVRPWLVREQHGIPFAEGLAAVFVERLADMLMLLGMLSLVAFAVDLPDGTVVVQGIDVLAVGQRGAGIAVALGAAGLVAMMAVGDRIPLARRFREGLLVLVRRPATGAWVLLLSITIWALTILAVQLTLAGFEGLPASLSDALTTWTVTLTGMTALPTPGFFGGYEAAATTAVTVLGGHPDVAGAFAVVLHLGQFAFTVVLGSIFLGVEGLSLRDVVQRSRSHTDA